MDFTKLITQASDFVWGLIEEKVVQRVNEKFIEELQAIKAAESASKITEDEVQRICREWAEYGSTFENLVIGVLDGNDYEPTTAYGFRNAVEVIVKDEMGEPDEDEIRRIVKEMVADGEFVINAEITLDTM